MEDRRDRRSAVAADSAEKRPASRCGSRRALARVLRLEHRGTPTTGIRAASAKPQEVGAFPPKRASALCLFCLSNGRGSLTMRRVHHRAAISMAALLGAAALSVVAAAQEPAPQFLPGSLPLTFEGDLSVEMRSGFDRFL